MIKKILFTFFCFFISFNCYSQIWEVSPNNQFEKHFEETYNTYPSIPRGILESIAYTKTHIQHIEPEYGIPSCTGLPHHFGVMGLVENGKNYFRNSLEKVAEISKYSAEDIKNNPRINILAFAKAYNELLEINNLKNEPIQKQLKVIDELSEIPNNQNSANNFAFDTQVYSILKNLLDPKFQEAYNLPKYEFNLEEVFGAENFKILNSTNVLINNERINGQRYNSNYSRLAPPCNDVSGSFPYAILSAAADPSNYSSRSGTAITHVTIHTMQGSYAGAISWFQNPAANVSAHYNMRASDGQITQSVCEIDKAWHVSNSNPYAVGIEHEGYIDDPTWYTSVMYQKSAVLTKDIAARNGIPIIRTYDKNGDVGVNSISDGCFKIKGHQHFPSQTHVDPGPYWDWNRYYDLINDAVSATSVTYTACSGTIYDSGGSTGNYGNDERIFYKIQPTGATSVTLNFTSLNLETNYDYLYIYDGDSHNDPLLTVLNGTTLPPSITANSGKMLLEFRTDCATVASGWVANYSCNTSSVACEMPSGLNESNMNHNSVQLNWNTVPSALSYEISFKQTLDSTPTIYTSTTDSKVISGLAAGGQYIWTVKSVCNAGVKSVANSNEFTNSSTITNIVDTNCSGTFTDTGGILGGYTNNENYTYTISPTGASSVTLSFSAFNIENNYDFIRIYDGPTTASTLLGTYTNTNTPPNITSSGGSLTIKFTSDNATMRSGWIANWTCTEEIKPTFTNINPICSGTLLSELPTTSNNGYTGSWSPALNNTTTTTYTFSPSNGQNASTTELTIVVNPIPTVNQPVDQVVNNGALTSSVLYNGDISNTDYNWTNDTPSIGLASSGIGNINSFSAVNLSTDPIVATITVTPLNTSIAPGPVTFTNSSTILIPENQPTTTQGIASLYPSSIIVSGLPTTGVKVESITINGITHTWSRDVRFLLVSPTGQTFAVMDKVGGGSGFDTTSTVTIADGFQLMPLGTTDIIPTGTYAPTANPGTSSLAYLSSPAPPGPYNFPKPEGNSTFESVFDTTTNYNGTWNLYVFDTGNGDIGSIAEGWSLTLISPEENYICSGTSKTFTITVNPTNNCASSTTWNGTTWSNGSPDLTKEVIFSGNYNSTASIFACRVQITNNTQVTFNNNHTLIVNDDVVIENGSLLIIKDNAALRQVNNTINTGNIRVEKNSAPMIRLDYTGWSSPVENQQLQAFSPNTLSNRFYEYLYTGTTTATAYQTVNSATNFESGKGYLIRVANNWSTSTPTIYNGQFNGIPANGTMNIPVGIGYNLLGNPYPSPISGNSFLGQNPSINTLYFWTHTAAASGGAYPANNFASYTTLGGTAAAAGGSIPNGTINTGQGFYINKSTAGSALFKNNQRVNAATSSQFFRTTEEPETHRFWLNLNDDTTNYNQILIGYTENASHGIDPQIDGEVLDKSQSYLFNIINDDEYVIQGRGLPFSDEDIVPLGIEIKSSGNYSIAFENADGLFSNQEIYLKDNQTNTIHNIKENQYSFYSDSGNTTNRFEIVYKNSMLGNEDFELNQIQVYSSNEIITVDSKNETITEIIVFDIVGRMLFHKKNVDSNTFEIRNLTTQNQTLLLKVISSSNKEKTVKIMH